MTILEEKEIEETQSFETEEHENFDIWKKNLEFQEDEEISENVILNQDDISIQETNFDEFTDWYEEEIKNISLDKDQLNSKQFSIWKEQELIIKELSNIWTSLEKHEENDHRKILMWLTMKWMPNISNVIEERNSYETIFDILNSQNINKKALEVLFYSNSMKEILWKDYLENYTFENIYEVYKNISKNENFLKLILKSRKYKEHTTLIKKQFLSNVKFMKEKQNKKTKEQNSLFSFNLDIQKETTLEKFEKFQNKYSSVYNTVETNKIAQLLKWINIKEERYRTISKLFLFSFFDKKEYYFFNEILKQFKKWKVLKDVEKIDFDIFLNQEKEIYKWMIEEFTEIFKKTTHNLLKEKLWNKAYNTNIKKYIWVTWFVDDEMYWNIKEKFKDWIHQRIYRNWIMSKFISWNEWFKKEIFSKLSNTDDEKFKLQLLYTRVDVINKIQDLKIKSRQYLKTLTLDQCTNLLIYVFKEKKQVDENDVVWECLKLCWFSNVNEYFSTKRLKDTLNKIYKNRNATDEEKENILIDSLIQLPWWWFQKISLKFWNQIKKILIELFTKIINEYISNFRKNEEFNEKYWVTMLWYIKWDNLKKKWRSVSYITEKWTYWISLYWVFSSLFSRLEWIWLMNVKINWNWREQLSWIKFLSLDEKFYEWTHWKKTLIQKEELNKFKNYKSKLIKYLRMILFNPENFNNTILSIDSKNNYMFMKILERDEYNQIKKMYISDWETSVILSPQEWEKIINSKNSIFEEKDFISTIRVKEKQNWIVSVTWLDDDWEFKNNDILTNLSFDKDLDKFELQMNKWFLWFYLLYFKKFFDETDYLKYHKWMIIFDLETIWFTWNILLSYFLYIWKFKWKDCVILKRHSNPEYWNFFDNFCKISTLWDLKSYIENRIDWSYLLSWHNTLWFDNKRLSVDMYWSDNSRVYQTKSRIDKYSLDTLKIIENEWFWKIGLDSLSKANFDFWKNITKASWWLMSVINDILKVIKDWDEWIIKKNEWKIKRFVLYNKNDVLMSTWILWQMLKYWKIVTEKWICKVDVQKLIKEMRWF